MWRFGACATLVALGCGSESETPALLGAGGASASSATASTSSVTTSGAGGAEEKLGPPYPIVLAHGFFGFEDFAGLDFVNYFYEVKAQLAIRGEELVFTPDVDPFNSSVYRGAQLAAEVQDILALTGHQRVILIGHSQGGLDARVVAHDYPELVAAVVTLQTPHYGTPLADVALEVLDDPNLKGVLDALLQLAGMPLWDEVGNTTSLYLPLYDLSTAGIAEFNANYPDAENIHYASIAGRSDFHGGGEVCNVTRPAFIEAFDDELDPVDGLLATTEMIIDGGFGNPYANDGLVRAADARWGEFLGCLPADHLDMIGHLLGDDPGIGNGWDYRAFYVDLVAYLRARGF